jgi:hypothetical protein
MFAVIRENEHRVDLEAMRPVVDWRRAANQAPALRLSGS